MDDWRVNCFSIIYRGCNHSNLSTKSRLSGLQYYKNLSSTKPFASNYLKS